MHVTNKAGDWLKFYAVSSNPPVWRHTYVASMAVCEQKFGITQYLQLHNTDSL
jgi:hypothetical protein